MVTRSLGGFKNLVSSQTEKLMAATKFSYYLGLKHYNKSEKIKHFIPLRLAHWPQSFATYCSKSPTGNSGYQLQGRHQDFNPTKAEIQNFNRS